MDRYYVLKGNIGYVICEQGRRMPLPFTYISKQYADEACYQFNQGGYRAIAEYYYVHEIAGKWDTKPILELGKNPYKEWMAKNGDIFKLE